MNDELVAFTSSPGPLLFIAYPLQPVSPESAGGAEQMLATLAAEFARRDWPITTAAATGSRVAGELIETVTIPRQLDQYEIERRRHAAAILRLIRQRQAARPFAIVHDESSFFWTHARRVSAPVLATLHLPRSFYDQSLFADLAPNVSFNCVSHSQAATFADLPSLVGVIENGILVERFPYTRSKDNYLLFLGRICPEKGVHLAIAVARRARLPLVIAGQIYPFREHQQYFEQQIRPHLDGLGVRLVESPALDHKLELLRRARAVLVPSLCAETSSLVSLEAMACGTPVIAFRQGALPEIVADRRTGFIVETAEQMAEAVYQVATIDPRNCRLRVEQRFTAARMAANYAGLYRRILNEGAYRRPPAA